jgi:DnaJ-class molecular chaperone
MSKQDYVVCPQCRGDGLLALECWLCEGDRVIGRQILIDIKAGMEDAKNGNTHDISTLWDGIDDEETE